MGRLLYALETMSLHAERSPGILLSPLGDAAVAYDLITEKVHHLNGTAGAILAACDGDGDPSSIADDWAALAGTDTAQVTADIDRIIATFTSLGLVGRTELLLVPAPRTGSPEPAGPTGSTTTAIWVLDTVVALRGPTAVVDLVTSRLGLPAAPADDARVDLDLIESDGGGIDAVGDDTWHFASTEALADQIVTLLNLYATSSPTCLALHAGGVRTPDGRIILLPAESGSGKSTLTAALVAAGCDLLGDEIVGLDTTTGQAVAYPRRIALGEQSRVALGLDDRHGDRRGSGDTSDAGGPEGPDGDDGTAVSGERDVDPGEIRADVVRLAGRVGPVDAIVSPAYSTDHGSEPTSTRLDLTDAFNQLLANTLNLLHVGQPGLDVLCHVAETAASYRLDHDNAKTAAELLVANDDLV